MDTYIDRSEDGRKKKGRGKKSRGGRKKNWRYVGIVKGKGERGEKIKRKKKKMK